ncbi:Hypothetical predicted protein [Mytilus galloprovincialis]|uniref:Uncharacterized protein n=1 Tax=Mytilus galloprovincialis TaxID=29158 RepID=A0A8B6DVD3_MYTGA|nr:Hypothetical predicted protein [Mytilus galloprovincialis]
MAERMAVKDCEGSSCYWFGWVPGMVSCDVCQAFYSLKCPERPHWKTRADSKCNGIADKYHCLYDKNNENITEFCASPKDYTAGKQFLGILIDFVTRIKVNKKHTGETDKWSSTTRYVVFDIRKALVPYSSSVTTFKTPPHFL